MTAVPFESLEVGKEYLMVSGDERYRVSIGQHESSATGRFVGVLFVGLASGAMGLVIANDGTQNVVMASGTNRIEEGKAIHFENVQSGGRRRKSHRRRRHI